MELSNAYTDKSNEDLILAYKKSGNPTIKQEIVLRYSYIVKTIAKQMYSVYVSFADMDDIVNEGIIALMGALEKFVFSKNVKFETYASLRVRGSIIDLARKQDWIPRSLRKTAKTIDNAEARLYSEWGRHPTDQEMADYLGYDLDKYLKMVRETNLHNVLSLDALMDTTADNSNFVQPIDYDETGMPEVVTQKNEMSRVLKESIMKLRENEQLTLSLYYRKDLNMREIANVLGVKEPRVSQIHANAIRKLRIELEKYMKE